jgi:hypothetical protein
VASGRRPAVALGAGLALVVTGFLAGPRSPLTPSAPSFDNTHLALASLPDFDTPYPGTPDVYGAIAKDPGARVLELPTLRNRGVVLLRNYQLQHGNPVFFAWTWRPELRRCRPPYVWVENPQLVRDTGVGWIVLHRDLRGEIVRYLRFIEERATESEGLIVRLLTRSVRAIPRPDIELIRSFLEERHGPPLYADELVFAWRL